MARWPATTTLAVLLAAVLAGEVLWARLRHRTLDEVTALATTGSGDERRFALHVLASRAPPGPIDAAFVDTLLASPDPRVREMAMTADFTRLTGKKAQRQHVRSAPAGESERLDFLLRFQAQRMTRADLERFFASLDAGGQ